MFDKEPNKWENVYLKKYGMYYSRIIASWLHVGGNVFDKSFREWMASITDANTGEKVLTEDQIWAIYNLATNGKLEWQHDALEFMKNHQ